MNKSHRLLLGVLLGAGWPLGAGALDLSVACPTSVQAGQRLNVVVTLENRDCSPRGTVTVNRLMRGLGGNGGGGLELVGPFDTVLDPPKVVPAATSCNQPRKLSFRLTMTRSTPTSFAGTMAIAYVQIVDASGRGRSGSTCFVQVVP